MKALLDTIQKIIVGPHMAYSEEGRTETTLPPPPEPEEGPVSAEDVSNVQTTWEMAVPIADQAADIFYDRLFELDESLRSMFPEDMAEQKKKLMQMITVAVRGLDKLDEIVPAVQQLGKRHAGYGVKDEHYETVGGALLFTLGQGLGEAFTPEVEISWTKVYTLLADTMKAAANEQAAS